MPKRRRLLYKEVIADEPHDGDTIAIVSMSGTCSCSIFVTIKVPTAGFPAQYPDTKDFLSWSCKKLTCFVRSRSKNGITRPQSFGNWRTGTS
jgi:hypothetical protein